MRLYHSRLTGWGSASMKTFSTAQIAKILKVRPSWVREQAERTLVDPERDRRGHYRYSFQDIVLLRAARHLRGARFSSGRIAEILKELSRSLPENRSLSSVQLRSDGQRILARDSNMLWEPESRQTVLDFDTQPRVPDVAELPASARSCHVAESDCAADWFNLAFEYENGGSLGAAEDAYRRACERDPGHVNSRINLGRLRHAANALDEAESLYREALTIEPEHAIALFNLGVVLEDRGDDDSAIRNYKMAIDADPGIPEAHYNLARLYVRRSAESDAIRHYARYKALIRDGADS
jgi:tetratricopeptide (TPR) repeat protein